MPLMMSHFSPFPIDTPALRVQGLGVQERMQPVFFDRPRGWPFYLFVLFHGAAICRTRDRESRVPPGTLVCWRPGTPHGLGDARRALNHSWLSVGGRAVTIAAHVGFSDVHHFNKSFRRHFGRPPGAFRAALGPSVLGA